MDHIRASNKGSLAPVLEWRVGVVEPDQGSVTSRLTKECISVFRELMKKLRKEAEVSQETVRRLERSCSSLVLWDSGYDVAKGGLDDVLEKSRTLRRSILMHLISISRALADRLPHLIGPKDEELGPYRALSSTATEAEEDIYKGYQDGNDSDDSDDSDGGSSSASLSSDWDEIAEDVWTDIQCLLDLDSLIKSPAPDIVQVSQDRQKAPVERDPHAAFTDRIRARFPHADPSLADRLGHANWERFLKGNADREKSQNASLEPAGIEVAATIADTTSKFNDSGLGASINTGSAYAETVMSYRREGGESVRIPPLPKEAKQGKPFECVACGQKLIITNSSAWKKHLYLDLCPWICHEMDCTYGTQFFRSCEDWIQHLGLGHGFYPEWKSFTCPMCHEDTGKGKIAISRHLSSHMEEISLASLPAGIETVDESDSCSDGPHSIRSMLEYEDVKDLRMTRPPTMTHNSVRGTTFVVEVPGPPPMIFRPRTRRRSEMSTRIQLTSSLHDQEHDPSGDPGRHDKRVQIRVRNGDLEDAPYEVGSP